MSKGKKRKETKKPKTQHTFFSDTFLHLGNWPITSKLFSYLSNSDIANLRKVNTQAKFAIDQIISKKLAKSLDLREKLLQGEKYHFVEDEENPMRIFLTLPPLASDLFFTTFTSEDLNSVFVYSFSGLSKKKISASAGLQEVRIVVLVVLVGETTIKKWH